MEMKDYKDLTERQKQEVVLLVNHKLSSIIAALTNSAEWDKRKAFHPNARPQTIQKLLDSADIKKEIQAIIQNEIEIAIPYQEDVVNWVEDNRRQADETIMEFQREFDERLRGTQLMERMVRFLANRMKS